MLALEGIDPSTYDVLDSAPQKLTGAVTAQPDVTKMSKEIPIKSEGPSTAICIVDKKLQQTPPADGVKEERTWHQKLYGDNLRLK